MKKLVFLLVALLCFSCGISQVLPDYKNYKLDTATDCQKADTIVHQVANYLLQTPIKLSKSTNIEAAEYDKQRLDAASFLMKWMERTSEYSFSLDHSITKLDIELMSMYLAAMVKYSIENKNESEDLNIQKLNSWKILLEYCDNPTNNVEMSEKLKKLSDANKKGELKAYM